MKQFFTLVAAMLCTAMVMAQTAQESSIWANCGDSVTIQATPATGRHFVQWSDGDTRAMRRIGVTGNDTLRAIFAVNQYDLTIGVSGEGTTDVGSGSYDYGTILRITAKPNDCYHFVNWSNGSTDPTITITIEEDTTLVAFFEIDTFNITVISDDAAQGTVTVSE